MDAAAATVSPQPESRVPARQYLTFELAGQDYGVEILRVQEIKGWERPTRLPHSPPHIQGVINLRGAVVPIIDLRCRFGLPESPQTHNTVVIVVRVEAARGELTAGLVVDAVCEVCDLSSEQLRAPPEMDAGVDAQFVRGLAMLGERMLVLLDVAHLLGTTLGEPTAASRAA
ncbi:MAG TPA: chemotaxis protein CheW [Steroidobacteraceae bacterium]|nr:chemotaxis protein CheW [Steroidobacteraceae bacterium]